jgi:hypothetical protein
MGRHEIRANAAIFRREAHDDGLLTFLVEPNDRRLRGAPLLQQTANQWLDRLPMRTRFCVCSSWLHDRNEVGLVLLAAAATARPPTSASCCGICRGCSDADLPMELLEHAAERVLREALPGQLEPMGPRR